MDSEASLVQRIVARVPAIDRSDPVGPHTALGYLMLTLRDMRRGENPEYESLLDWTLALVEELAAAPPGSEERNIVYASFFDNLHHLEGDCVRVRGHLGPNAAALVEAYENKTGRLCEEAD